MDSYIIDFQPLLFLTHAFGNKFWIVVLEAYRWMIRSFNEIYGLIPTVISSLIHGVQKEIKEGWLLAFERPTTKTGPWLASRNLDLGSFHYSQNW